MHGRLRRFGMWAGALSYPIYALQGPVRRLVGKALSLTDLPRVAIVTLLCASVLIVSWVVSRWFDEPARKLLRRLLHLRRTSEVYATLP